jgi:hypothetical protein
MLNENDIVDAVCEYIETKYKHYKIDRRLSTGEQGIDIVASHPKHGTKIIVEAKGGTSSLPQSSKFGEPYNRSKVLHQTAIGLYQVLRRRDEYPSRRKTRIFLACPDTPLFREHLNPIKTFVRGFGIQILLVQENGEVKRL